MANLVDIIKNIVGQIDLVLPVLSITNGSGEDTVYVCETTLHMTIGKIVTDSQGKDYIITDILNNVWVLVEPHGSNLDKFTGPTITAPPITVLHGTPSSAGHEYLELLSSVTLEKTPFIWLLEPYDTNQLEADTSLDASFNARLFFMDWADLPEWPNDSHNNYAIKPMENLADAFVNVINEDYNYVTPPTPKRVIRPRFGVIRPDKGSDAMLISEDLSGVELTPTIEIFDSTVCLC